MTNQALIEIVEHVSAVAAAEVAADEAGAWLGMCALSGSATAALPGGRSPTHLLKTLACQPVAWSRVTVTTTDERNVPIDHALSNMGALRRAFRGTAGESATFVALDRCDADRRIRVPFDLCILGIGADGHIASLFPSGPLSAHDPHRIIEVTPSPLPVEAPVARHTWSLSTLASSRRTLLVCAGDEKRRAFERALTDDLVGPFGQLVRHLHGPLTIHWARA